jgi:hypothetical protein
MSDPRTLIKRFAMYTVAALVLLTVVLYAGDYAILRYRIARHKNPFGAVTVTPEYVVHEKNGKTEYDFAQPQNQTCSHSLFPQAGYQPCWYLSRHTEQQIQI